MSAVRTQAIVKMGIKHESDIVFLRQRVRTIAAGLGFENQDQIRIATSISELGRNAFQYAGGGFADISLNTEEGKQSLSVAVFDRGPGIANLDEILYGNYVSRTGMGLGILGARRLMDKVDIQTTVGAGTRITAEKYLPFGAKEVGNTEIAQISKQLAMNTAQNPYQELKGQNQDLMVALADLTEKKAELAQLNLELENTNRGVVALYAELDEHAANLKKVSETKTSFLANMTHEFRTPVNSILNISSFLIDPDDGVKDPEHLKQVQYIRKSAAALSELVNDLLDLSKVEAGKVQVRPTMVKVSEIFGTVRGLMRPLQDKVENVELLFAGDEECDLYVDEGKINQILRNLVSNALKYTERGSVTVSADCDAQDFVIFRVTDTGIGIAPENLNKIFEEFIQIDSPLQRKVRGTGLGLSLTYRMAKLLGGELTVTSTLGKGSVFEAKIPRHFSGAEEGEYISSSSSKVSLPLVAETGQLQNLALVIDDDEAARYAVLKVLTELGIPNLTAENGEKGIALAKRVRPKLIFLDLVMPDYSGYEVIKSLLSDPATRSIPIIVSSSQDLTEEELKYLTDITLGFIPKSEIITSHEKIRALTSLAGFDYAE